MKTVRRLVMTASLAAFAGLAAPQPAVSAQGDTAVRKFSSLQELEREETRLRKEGKNVRRVKVDEAQLQRHQNICGDVLGDEWRTIGCWAFWCLCFNNPFD